MKYRLILVIFSLIFCVSCYQEDPLVPTETPESKYTLPQGNHDYDTKILNWHERCGFYILYKFQPQDIYWDINYWRELRRDTVNNIYMGFRAKPAHEAYAGKLLDVLERTFLNFYPDTLLRRCMPMKLLLCSELTEADYYDYNLREKNFMSGFDYFAVNYGNEKIESISPADVNLLNETLNMAFLNRLLTNKKMAISPEFLTVSLYYENPVEEADMYAWGYIKPSPFQEKSKEGDWKEFLEAIVKNSYDYLNAEPEDGDYSFKGILHEKKDVAKQIRKKYDILIRYFKSAYNIDIQAIGNSKEANRE